MIALYWEMLLSQLRDRNAGAHLSIWQRLQRGHRLGVAAILTRLGPPYRRWWLRLTYLRSTLK